MRKPDYSRIPWRKMHTAPPPSLRASWGCLDLHARGLYWLLLSATEQDGSIILDDSGLPSVAGVLYAPWEMVKPALMALIGAKWVQHDQTANVLRLSYFDDSQEAVSPEAERKRRQREKEEAERAAKSDNGGQKQADNVTVTGQSRDSHGQSADESGTVTTELRSEKGELRSEKKDENSPSFPQKVKAEPLKPLQALAALVQGIDPTQDPKMDEAEPGKCGPGWDRAWEALQCPRKTAGTTTLPMNTETAWYGVWRDHLAKFSPPPSADDMRKLGRWIKAGGASETRKQWFTQLDKPNVMTDWFSRSQQWDGNTPVTVKQSAPRSAQPTLEETARINEARRRADEAQTADAKEAARRRRELVVDAELEQSRADFLKIAFATMSDGTTGMGGGEGV